MTERACAGCRFGEPVNDYRTQCGWVTNTQDEAGDRMPSWAHEVLKAYPAYGEGENDRAETCPAYEERTS